MKNILYINPLSPEIIFMVFTGNEIFTSSLIRNLDTASTFPQRLVEIVERYTIEEIWCVVWPWAFTLMRILTLSINALTYTRDIRIKSCHFFDLITSGNIPIIEANQKEYIIQKNNEIFHVQKNDLEKGTYEGIISANTSTEGVKYIQYTEEKNNISSVFSVKSFEDRISPIYFKPPHITWPKH